MRGDILHTAFASAICGVLFHLLVLALPFEFELVMFHFMATYVVASVGYTFTLMQVYGMTFLGALGRVALSSVIFNAATLSSIAIYRLFFHRCRNIPGPVLARLTRFYAMYQTAKEMTYFKELDKMHQKYGDFVRVGPRDVSVMRKEALPLVYGPKTECRKATWYGQQGHNPKKLSLSMLRDKKLYRLRRRAWDRGLSMKALASYETRIKANVEKFISQIQKRSGEGIDATAWSMLYSFDIMGDVGFSKDFENLSSGTEHPAIKVLHDHVKILATLVTVPWLLNMFASIPGAGSQFAIFFKICADQLDAKVKGWSGEKQPEDVMSWLLKAVKENDVSAAPSREALEDDCRVLIIAGSDTKATALACLLYYLAKYPRVQKKLQALIGEAMLGGYSEWSYTKVKSVTYLDDIINETLRLKPPFMVLPPRETPPQGMHIGDTYIPGNTNVYVAPILIHRDPRWWKEPEEFLPERWGELRAEMHTDEAPYIPFNSGLHSCPGQNLAIVSLRYLVSSVVQNFDIEFAPGETGETFDKDFEDTALMKLPPLKLRFVKRG
ncbi:cytochrome P450 67 [Westerdykella ornata]|uniref:Cytochrome P450 67 n=1 Tax=Westerdykella ornata TaxID=318751 RepID=A0A6A6JCD8_WESOR|nr:cytochrome P450 67 [Westerdykella ornata]KAF2272859.1 cytochrome P450 67 [Westerdykella ornata]